MATDFNSLAQQMLKNRASEITSSYAAPKTETTSGGGFFGKLGGFLSRATGSFGANLLRQVGVALDTASSVSLATSNLFMEGLGIAKDVYTSSNYEEMLSKINSRNLKFSDLSKNKEDAAFTKAVGSSFLSSGNILEQKATEQASKLGLGSFGQSAADITGDIAGTVFSTKGLGGPEFSFSELTTGSAKEIAKKFAIRAATNSPLQTAAFIAGAEGRLPTGKELGVGTLIDFTAGAAFGKAAKYLNSKKLVKIAKTIEDGLSVKDKNALLTEAGVTTIDDWMKSIAKESVETKKPFFEAMLDKTTKTLAYTTDTMIPLERYLADAYFKAGIDPLTLGSKYSVTNAGDEALRYKAIGDQLISDTGFSKIVTSAMSNSDFQQLDKYLQARRTIELAGKQEILPMPLDKAKQGVALLEDKFKVHQEIVRTHNHALLDMMVDAGIFEREFVDALKKEFPDYVPMERVVATFDAGTPNIVSKAKIGSLSKQTLLKRLSETGSEAEVKNVIETMYKNTYDAVKQAQVNKVANAIIAQRDLSEELAKAIIPIRTYESVTKAGKGAEDVASTAKQLDLKKIPYITRIKNGVKEIWQVPEDIALSAKYMTPEGLGKIMQTVNLFTRAFKLGTTTLNLVLTPALYAYDAVSAFTNIMPGATKYLYYPEIYLRSWYETAANRLGLQGGLYDKLRKMAALGNQFDISKHGLSQGEAAITERFARQGTVKGLVLDTPKKALATIEHVMSIPEEAVRMRIFLATQKYLEKTGKYTQDQIMTAAANEARNVTGNYYRKGVYGAFLNSTFAYFGAWQAGARSFIRSAVRSPESFAKKIGGVITLSGAVVSWNLMDPRRKAVYEQIQDYEKDRNMIIVLPWAHIDEKTGRAEGVIKFPFANEMSFAFNPVRRMIESHFINDPLTAREIGLDFVNSFSYINMSNLEGWQDIPGRVLSGAIGSSPILKVPVEEITNHDLYFGGPKYSQAELKSGISKNTSVISQIVGDELGVAPLHIQGTIEGYFGSTAGDITRMMDSALVYLGLASEGQKSTITMAQKFRNKYVSAMGGKWESELYDEIQKSVEAEDHASALEKLRNPQSSMKRKNEPELSPTDKKLKDLGVESGARAKFLNDYLMALPADERKIKYDDWKKKGVISKDVKRQLHKLGFTL